MQLPGFSGYPVGWPSQLIRRSWVELYFRSMLSNIHWYLFKQLRKLHISFKMLWIRRFWTNAKYSRLSCYISCSPLNASNWTRGVEHKNFLKTAALENGGTDGIHITGTKVVRFGIGLWVWGSCWGSGLCQTLMLSDYSENFVTSWECILFRWLTVSAFF